jgi:hypothetical protein
LPSISRNPAYNHRIQQTIRRSHQRTVAGAKQPVTDEAAGSCHQNQSG